MVAIENTRTWKQPRWSYWAYSTSVFITGGLGRLSIQELGHSQTSQSLHVTAIDISPSALYRGPHAQDDGFIHLEKSR